MSQLPPRNYVVDGDITRLANDEEYAEYLSIVISQEGLVIISEEDSQSADPDLYSSVEDADQ
jgi:hypothetical protein